MPSMAYGTFQVLVTQHVEHGPAGCATGLAVVDRRGLAAGQQCPAHVGGARVLLPQRGHHRLGGGAVGHGLDAADEAALFDNQLAVRGCGDCLRH
jgi:hypothetical protein